MHRMLDSGYGPGNGVLRAAGEFVPLEMDERKLVSETIMEAVNGQIPVVVGVQDTSSKRILELARFAHRIGADGIQVDPPFYDPATIGDIVDMLKKISAPTVRHSIALYPRQ